jgi:hypothetical protein
MLNHRRWQYWQVTIKIRQWHCNLDYCYTLDTEITAQDIVSGSTVLNRQQWDWIINFSPPLRPWIQEAEQRMDSTWRFSDERSGHGNWSIPVLRIWELIAFIVTYNNIQHLPLFASFYPLMVDVCRCTESCGFRLCGIQLHFLTIVQDVLSQINSLFMNLLGLNCVCMPWEVWQSVEVKLSAFSFPCFTWRESGPGIPPCPVGYEIKRTTSNSCWVNMNRSS